VSSYGTLWVDGKGLNNNGIHPQAPRNVSINYASGRAVFKLLHNLGRRPYLAAFH